MRTVIARCLLSRRLPRLRGVRNTSWVASGWNNAIARFRECVDGGPAQQAYLDLLVGARARWEGSVCVHPWRLDVLVLLARSGSADHQVWIEYRVRDGVPILVFKLGPVGTIGSEQVVAGNICRVETGPVVLDAFLWQIGQPRTPDGGDSTS